MRYWSLLFALGACTGSEEAPRVDVPVTTASAAIPVATTDLGYSVALSSVRIAVTTVQFTTGGETHQDVARTTPGALSPLPHPGHSAGGEVTGELPGDHVLVWNGQEQPMLGVGTLLAGDYSGANFTFRAASESDGLPATDRLLGHTFELTGTISKGTTTKPFVAVLDVEVDAAVVGALFEATISEGTSDTLALQFTPTDPYEGDTPFDGVDFFTLPDTAGSLEIAPGSTAHNLIRRAIQTHDFYSVVAQ